MREAVAELERSAVAREVLGDAVYEHYCHTARLELEAYDRLVTHAELVRNFEQI
jgi:glutamine synthetase